MFVPARDEDIADIVDLINRAYASGAGSSWSAETAYFEGDRTTESLLQNDMAQKPMASLLKWRDETDGRIIGCVWLEPTPGSVWYLGSLAIDPAKQNGGLGRVMLQAAENGRLITAQRTFGCQSSAYASR